MNTYNIIGSMFGALLIALPVSADNTQQAYKNLKIQNKAIRKVGNQVKVAMDLNLDHHLQECVLSQLRKRWKQALSTVMLRFLRNLRAEESSSQHLR